MTDKNQHYRAGYDAAMHHPKPWDADIDAMASVYAFDAIEHPGCEDDDPALDAAYREVLRAEADWAAGFTAGRTQAGSIKLIA